MELYHRFLYPHLKNHVFPEVSLLYLGKVEACTAYLQPGPIVHDWFQIR